MGTIRLTQYSHGAGCGCKIAPGVLDGILAKAGPAAGHKHSSLVIKVVKMQRCTTWVMAVA
jgi:selenophosphate synthase